MEMVDERKREACCKNLRQAVERDDLSAVKKALKALHKKEDVNWKDLEVMNDAVVSLD